MVDVDSKLLVYASIITIAFILSMSFNISMKSQIDNMPESIPKIVGHCYFAQIDVPCKDANPNFNCEGNDLTRQEAIQLCGKYLG